MAFSTAGGALAGLRVVDLSRVLGGPYATQILADHGAEVIKIEPPAGDETRDWGPPFRDGVSAYFTGVNRSKQALSLDLTQAPGRDVLLRLLERADILVENFKVGTLEKWGLGFEEVLSVRFPRLVHCTITGFGADGPLGGFPGYDLMVQAWTGMVSVNGAPESGPLRLGVPIVDLATGLNGVIGILMALRERDLSGRGQHIDVCLFDTAISLMHPHAANWFMSGKRPPLSGNAHPSIAPYGLHRALGKPLFIGAGNDRQFAKLCEVLGCTALAHDPRFAHNEDRIANRPALTAALEARMADRDAEELAVTLMRAGVPAGAVLSVDEALEQPHTAHRAMLVEEDGYRGTGVPIKLSRTPGQPRSLPPRFNADGDAVLRDAGFSGKEIAELKRTGAVPTQRRRPGGTD